MMEIIFIVIGIVICTVVPLYAKNHFEEKYNVMVLMPGPVICNCVALLSILLFNLNDLEEWIAVVISVFVYSITCTYVFKRAKEVCSARKDIILAVAANALLPIGIVAIIFMILVTFYVSSEGKKKR